jgi:hypothetical protein
MSLAAAGDGEHGAIQQEHARRDRAVGELTIINSAGD